jgi:2-hydroxycyclohexanecarboxyl-CoA dehydrogenase
MSDGGPDSGRTALVTGGAGGIGRAICACLAARGDVVAVADLDSDAADRTADELRGAIGLGIDVTSAASVADAISTATSELGPILILVNAAGWDTLMPFTETDEELWDRVIEINFKGCLRTSKAVLGGMADAGWGRIVNVSSDAGRVGSSLESVYSGAKGGVIAFTKTLAREHARDGVTANTVCPGPTRTPLLEGMAGHGERGSKLITALERAVPMGRLGEPEDVAAAVAYLTSDAAGYVTGQTLSVSGGLTMA